MFCHADTCTDEELRQDVLKFLTTRCCGRVEARRRLTNEIRFDGDTNRLACVLAEFAQTNDAQIAEWAMWQLEKYATSAQLPFLYSCATNPVLGKTAVESVLRIEGVTSNSIAMIQRYICVSNEVDALHWDHVDVLKTMSELMSSRSTSEAERRFAIECLVSHAPSNSLCPRQLDSVIMSVDPDYQYSQRRLAVLRFVESQGLNEYQAPYVTNAINELVVYPEADLPD